jgi:hypothetical protein
MSVANQSFSLGEIIVLHTSISILATASISVMVARCSLRHHMHHSSCVAASADSLVRLVFYLKM